MEYHFIFADAPHSSAHASTIVETSDGFLAAWFGGEFEGSADTGIWLARFKDGEWRDHYALPATKESAVTACWNPVLHRSQGCHLLFYRIGPDPRSWWSELLFSSDEGKTWEPADPLPEQFLGPIKNKPLEIEPGVLLCPSSTESPTWNAHVEGYSVSERTWLHRAPIGDPGRFSAIQPTLLHWPDGRLQALCRSGKRVVAESWSSDKGKTWSDLKASELKNPNSGIDGVVLRDGRAALVINPTDQGRNPLVIALSDDGRSWRPGPLLEAGPGEYSYPAIIQADDGTIHVTYTYDRLDIRHVVLDAGELE